MNAFKLKIAFYTALALIAFAGNSILCRLALSEDSIDAASFTSIRLISGFAALAIIVGFPRKRESKPEKTRSWLPALLLFSYAVTFSFGYLSLDTGTGALILFGAVQSTMIIASLVSGNRLRFVEWIGMLCAFSGFTYLVAPTVNTPSFSGFIMMTLSGIAWGLYTLIGRGSSAPVLENHYNFLKTLPFIGIMLVFTFRDVNLSHEGILLAIISGGLASGLGYAFWYAALKGLSITHAAVLQLFVPIIAALGGVFFSGETISLRLFLSTLLVIGGILIVILSARRQLPNKELT